MCWGRRSRHGYCGLRRGPRCNRSLVEPRKGGIVILLHETFQIVHGGLDEFEEAYWNEVAPKVRAIDGIEPLWFLRQRTGIEGEFAIALTALRSGEDLGTYTRWISGREGAAWRAGSQRLTRAFQRKALLAAPWSPFNEWEELAPALEPRGDGRRIFMEDTGWPYVSVADYVDFQRRGNLEAQL